MSVLLSLLKGFSACSGLMMAVGAQDAFVIRQGLKRQHLFLTALLCSSIDALLILFGVIGFGYYLSEYSSLIVFSKYFAAIFFIFYGLFAFKSALKKSILKTTGNDYTTNSVKKIIGSLLTLSLLNPHVYLDTVILLGSMASEQPANEKMYFTLGAISASFAWFFAITFGAQLVAPFFQKANSLRIIDGCIAILMWVMAFNILHFI